MIVLTVGNASAWFGPFEINNATVFEDNWSTLDVNNIAKVHTSSHKHVRGYVNISGFENSCVLGGVQYVNGSPEDSAIVKYKAWHTEITGNVEEFVHTLTLSETCYMGNNTTGARLDISLSWEKRVAFGAGHFGWQTVNEPLVVEDSVDSPEVFDNSVDNYTVIITSYNNSVTPYTLIYLPARWNIVKENVAYNGSSTTWYPVIGMVETTSNGVEYVDFIDRSLHVVDPDHVIMRVDKYYVINEAPLDWELLEISVQTPYVSYDDLAWDVTVVHSKPSDYISWGLIVVFVFVLVVFVVAGYYVVNAGRI